MTVFMVWRRSKGAIARWRVGADMSRRERSDERASERGCESVVYTELIVLVFSLELDELEEGRAL